MKKNWLTKLDYRISLEVLVGMTLALYLLQQIAFYELLSEKVFIVLTLVTFLGLVLGLLSTSLILLIANLLLVSIGAFLLYFDPVIMLTKIKLLLIFSLLFSLKLNLKTFNGIFSGCSLPNTYRCPPSKTKASEV